MDEQFPLALPVGTNVNGYLINDVIGQGGFGITYLAYDTEARRIVALKEYLPASVALRNEAGTVTPYSVSGENDFAQGKESFLKEAQNLGRFRHEAIVQVLGYFEANGTAYTVMEFVKGDTLSHRIKQLKAEGKTMPEEEIMTWFNSVMNGLECVHKGEFMHRDIKPENIIINPETGKGCLIDFGAARHDAGGKTKSLSVVLTPGFAPIEQYSNAGKGQGTWTDVYALGATVWCAMTGEAPTDAPGRSTEIMYQHPDPVVVDRDKLIAAGYSQKLVNTVIRMMEVNSQDRVKSISDVKNMLRCGVAPQPDLSKTVMTSGASPVFPSQPTINAGNQLNEIKVSQSNNGSKKNIFIAGAIVLVLVLGGVGYYKDFVSLRLSNDAPVNLAKIKVSNEKSELSKSTNKHIDNVKPSNENSKASKSANKNVGKKLANKTDSSRLSKIGTSTQVSNGANEAKNNKNKQVEKDIDGWSADVIAQTRKEVRNYIFNTIATMKKFIKNNQEEEMWEKLAVHLHDSYKVFPKIRKTPSKTTMGVVAWNSENTGADIIETIVYDKIANKITITVEHRPYLKEIMSDKVK